MKRIFSIIGAILHAMAYYSGLLAIYRKFVPKEKSTYPTGTLWLIGIYIAFMGLARQNWEAQSQSLDAKVDMVLGLLGTPATRTAAAQVPLLQHTPLPVEPGLNPVLLYRYYFSDAVAQSNTVDVLKTALSSVRHYLDHTHLGGVILSDAEMTGANLQGSYFLNADFRRACFGHANLSEAIIDQVNADGAVFTQANLSKASLYHSTFRNAVMWAVDFTDARFDGTDIRGAKMYNVKGLTVEQLKKAIVDESTLLPPDLRKQYEEDRTNTFTLQ